ncbi:hypothetical protein BCR44DRAFT_120912 [Catenaria anguillulae PL171]|uniref:Chitin-binding type-4 domain-containing protein n=1 Tax=Catenaria anguillulae PL171 TaxID=765915 RepID=A0A1Y2HLQ1_9FUNG|nr:hypothetical protein BCR44DRAFT_120912 [Catenaria anguillulae PL171]
MRPSRRLANGRPLLVLTLVNLLVLSSIVSVKSHMMMTSPAPRQARNNPGPNGEIDYNGTSPLGVFPCKGFARQQSVLTVAAGESIPITIAGGAPHDGGHCQFALSYDDQTFVVIDTIIRECVRRSNPFFTTVTVPAGAPAGNATLAWTWINAIGNREYYMSCADITITNPSPTSELVGPALLVAHLPGFTEFSFPEFGGNEPDRRELFDRRPLVTVRAATATGPLTTTTGTAGGPSTSSTSSTPSPTPSASITPVPTVTSTPSITSTTRTTVSSIPSSTSVDTVPTATPTTTVECRRGEYTCVQGEPEVYLQCVFDRWMRRPTAPGTVCAERATSRGRSIVLVHAPKQSA